MRDKQLRSIEVSGVTHGGVPIPMGARVGNLIFSSGKSGKDPATNTLPSDAAALTRFAFQHLVTLVTNGGGTVGNIGRVTVFVRESATRELVNDEWVKIFPNLLDRPARHKLIYDLPAGMHVQLEAIAVVED